MYEAVKPIIQFISIEKKPSEHEVLNFLINACSEYHLDISYNYKNDFVCILEDEIVMNPNFTDYKNISINWIKFKSARPPQEIIQDVLALLAAKGIEAEFVVFTHAATHVYKVTGVEVARFG